MFSLKSYFVVVIVFLQICGGVAKKKGNVLVIVGKLFERSCIIIRDCFRRRIRLPNPLVPSPYTAI